MLLLFFDSRRDREWYELDVDELEADDPLVHLAWCERVLDAREVAAAPTGFGVPFLGCAKQLWLVNGRVVSPSTSELWRIQEYNTDGISDFIVCNRGHLSDAQQLKLLRSMPGKGLQQLLKHRPIDIDRKNGEERIRKASARKVLGTQHGC